MLPWCAGMNAVGWLLMVGFWGTFVALAVWAITRLIPIAPPDDPEIPVSAPGEPQHTATIDDPFSRRQGTGIGTGPIDARPLQHQRSWKR